MKREFSPTLNELEQLRRSLKASGIQTTAWHPSIKTLPKYTTFRVPLDEQAIPRSIVELSSNSAAKLYNIAPDNQNSFPAFNLNSPIFRVPEKMGAESLTLEAVERALPSLTLAYDARNGKIQGLERLRRLLRDFPAQDIVPKFSSSVQDPSLGSTLHLLDLLNRRRQSPEEFLRSFAAALIIAGQRGDVAVSVVLDVLFGKRNKKGSRDPWTCVLFLDLLDLAAYPNAVGSLDAALAWSDALLAKNAAQSSEKDVQCALDGSSGKFIGDKMPNPNLPILGATYLFSMNAEIPCQSRYRQSSTSLFPVTRESVQGVHDSLRHVIDEPQKGKTWSSIPSATSDKPDLLIAYIEEAPQTDTEIAGALGSEDEEEMEEFSSSEQMSLFVHKLNQLLKAVRMERGQRISDAFHLRLFVLSTIDAGRKQVLFDARYSIASVADGRDRWVAGAANVPAVNVRLFQGKGKKKRLKNGTVPSPVSVARSFRQLWIRQAERSETVSGVGLGRVYNMLLDPDAKREAAWLLERFLPLKTDLLVAAGKPRRDEKTGAIYTYTGAALTGPALHDLLIVTATLGILMSLLGRAKETYMNERDYLLGQLLQFADRLQIVYCHGVRGGQVPPQLIGNSLVDQAGQSPAKALAILQQRLPVYERYATQLLHSAEPVVFGEDEKDKEKARLARLKHRAWKDVPWIKAMLAKLSADVHRLGLEPASGAQGQAELLLGYLAAPTKSQDRGEFDKGDTE